jgi:hypothetical protein
LVKEVYQRVYISLPVKLRKIPSETSNLFCEAMGEDGRVKALSQNDLGLA